MSAQVCTAGLASLTEWYELCCCALSMYFVAFRDCGYSAHEAEQLVAASGAPSIKEELRLATEEALRLGAFGTPFIVLSGEGIPEDCRVFFGSDRLEHIAAVLGKQWRGPSSGISGRDLNGHVQPAKL
jgi:DSBA-like thioredoxin domain